MKALTLVFGNGAQFVADCTFDNNVGICVYKNPSENPQIGETDPNSIGKTSEDVNSQLNLIFTNVESIDVWIRALQRAKESASVG